MPALGPSLGLLYSRGLWLLSLAFYFSSSLWKLLPQAPACLPPCGPFSMLRTGWPGPKRRRAESTDPRRYLTPQEIVEALGGLTFRPCSCAGPSLTYFPMWKLIPLLEGNPVRIHLSCTGFLFLPLQNRGKEGKLAECDTFLYNLAPAGHSLEVPSLF